MPPSPLKPPRDAWSQWIGPETLIAQVLSTAPFLAERFPAAESGRLIDLGDSPDGFLRVLANWESLLRAGLSPEEQLQHSASAALGVYFGPHVLRIWNIFSRKYGTEILIAIWSVILISVGIAFWKLYKASRAVANHNSAHGAIVPPAEA